MWKTQNLSFWGWSVFTLQYSRIWHHVSRHIRLILQNIRNKPHGGPSQQAIFLTMEVHNKGICTLHTVKFVFSFQKWGNKAFHHFQFLFKNLVSCNSIKQIPEYMRNAQAVFAGYLFKSWLEYCYIQSRLAETVTFPTVFGGVCIIFRFRHRLFWMTFPWFYPVPSDKLHYRTLK